MSHVHNLPPGLLSFLYNAVYNKEVNEAIRRNIETVMTDFHLTDNQKAAIRAAKDRGSPNEGDIEGVVNLLVPFLMTHYPDVW
jgi:hypothetical protein